MKEAAENKWSELSKYLSGTLRRDGWNVVRGNNSIGKSAPGRPHSSNIAQPPIAQWCTTLHFALHSGVQCISCNAMSSTKLECTPWILWKILCWSVIILQWGTVQGGAANFEHPLIRITHTSGHLHPASTSSLSLSSHTLSKIFATRRFPCKKALFKIFVSNIFL